MIRQLPSTSPGARIILCARVRTHLFPRVGIARFCKKPTEPKSHPQTRPSATKCSSGIEHLCGISLMRSYSVAELVVLTWSAGGAFAQICGTTNATSSFRVEDLVGLDALLDAVNCTGAGPVEAVWAGALTLDAPISIGSGTFLSIKGEGDLAEVKGGGAGRLFDVSESGGLELSQLKLSGGAAENGGAIYSTAANVSIDSCVFEGNVASNGNGGAVWSKGGNLTIVGGEFVGNSAGGEETGNGGAVWASEGRLVVQGTMFDSNTAAAKGGGVFCDVAENATDAASGAVSYSFSEVVFTSNSAEESGGAVYGGEGSFMSIDECTFEGNTTPGNGGAVRAFSAALGGNTVLTNNVADGRGGAVSSCVHLRHGLELCIWGANSLDLLPWCTGAKG